MLFLKRGNKKTLVLKSYTQRPWQKRQTCTRLEPAALRACCARPPRRAARRARSPGRRLGSSTRFSSSYALGSVRRSGATTGDSAAVTGGHRVINRGQTTSLGKGEPWCIPFLLSHSKKKSLFWFTIVWRTVCHSVWWNKEGQTTSPRRGRARAVAQPERVGLVPEEHRAASHGPPRHARQAPRRVCYIRMITNENIRVRRLNGSITGPWIMARRTRCPRPARAPPAAARTWVRPYGSVSFWFIGAPKRSLVMPGD